METRVSGARRSTVIRAVKALRLLVPVAALAAGCGSMEADGAVAETNAALTGPVTFTITVPRGTDFRQVLLGAGNSVRVTDGVVLTSAAATGGVTSNTGPVTTEIGSDARVRSVASVSPVVIRSRARVDGSVTSGGAVSLQPPVTVTGGVTQNATLTPVTRVSWTVTFPAPGPSVNLQPDQRRVLAPGAYGSVTVPSRATLALSAGRYFFDSLSTEPQSVLSIDATGGPVEVYVAGNVLWRATTTFATGSGPANFLLGIVSANGLSIETPFAGTLVAPNASVRLAPTPATSVGHRGQFFARDITVEARQTVTFVPFASWGTLVPAPATGGTVTPT